jgi:ubiquinone/menaquinone biosynthesis C-methylase UbiE
MKSIFDGNTKKYDEWYDVHQGAFLSELAAIKKVLPENKKGLEIGVGTGRFAAALGIQCGIDSSPGMLALARERGIEVHVGCGEALPFAARFFDYVVILNALCFVKDECQVLQEARRVLKRDGMIIIGIIPRNSFLGTFYRQKESLFYKDANFMTPEELVKMLRMSGFGMFEYYQTVFSFPADITQPEVPLEGFDRGGFVVVSAKKE